MKKFVFLFCFAALLLLSGCGYRIGFTGHPQLSSMAVAPVTNETLLFNAAGTLRALLCERVMSDGSYKLKRESDADCILHARVLKAEFSEISWSSDDDDDRGNFFPEYYRVRVTVQYSLILPGKVKPLVGPATVTGTAMFDRSVDLENARRSGVKQALLDASKKIVDACTEAW
jgi:hypothetical protein